MDDEGLQLLDRVSELKQHSRAMRAVGVGLLHALDAGVLGLDEVSTAVDQLEWMVGRYTGGLVGVVTVDHPVGVDCRVVREG